MNLNSTLHHLRSTRLTGIAIAASLFWVDTAAHGQCSEILQKGIFDEMSYSSITEYQSDVAFVLTYTKKELEEMKSKNDSRLTLGIKKLISLGFSSDSEDEHVRQLAEQFKIDQRSSIQFSNLTNVTLKVVNKDIVNAWKECVTQDAGIKTEVLGQPKEGEQFIVRVLYRPTAVTDAKSLKITGVSCIGAATVGEVTLKPGATLGSFSSISQIFKRSGKESVAVTVDFEGVNGIVATIGPIPEAPVVIPPPKTQRHTVLSMSRSYTPPRTRGDRDFSTAANEPMTVRSDAKLEIVADRHLVLRLSMNAKEPRPDWTEVRGATKADDEQYRLYTAPVGWRVKRIITPDITQDFVEFSDAARGVKSVDPTTVEAKRKAAKSAVAKQSGMIKALFAGLYRWQITMKASNNSVVRKWKLVTDTEGDEAGTDTSVEVTIGTVELELEQVP